MLIHRVFRKILNLYFNAFGNAVTVGDEVSTPEIQATIAYLWIQELLLQEIKHFFHLVSGEKNIAVNGVTGVCYLQKSGQLMGMNQELVDHSENLWYTKCCEEQ